jgi:Domain of unknown function (DUF5668)
VNATSAELIQAVRGPIMLITLGTLVALDYFEGFSFTQRTWPVLLIVFGLLKLLERAVRPPVPPAPPGGYGPSVYPPHVPYPPTGPGAQV